MKVLLVVLLSLAPPLAAQGFVFDPDHCFTCSDSNKHTAAGAGIDLIAQGIKWPRHAWQRVGLVTLIGTAYEFGQESTVRYVPQLRGPGYGFSFKDLACDVAGALIGEGLGALWRKIT